MITDFVIGVIIELGLFTFVIVSEYIIKHIYDNIFESEGQCMVMFAFTNICLVLSVLVATIFK